MTIEQISHIKYGNGNIGICEKSLRVEERENETRETRPVPNRRTYAELCFKICIYVVAGGTETANDVECRFVFHLRFLRTYLQNLNWKGVSTYPPHILLTTSFVQILNI